jgi:hypothetical protein
MAAKDRAAPLERRPVFVPLLRSLIDRGEGRDAKEQRDHNQRQQASEHLLFPKSMRQVDSRRPW